MIDIPFQPVDEELKSVIRKSYIKPLAQWLLGNRPGCILAQEGNSNWESAMTIEFFIQAIDIFRRHEEEENLGESLENICPVVCRWLINNRVVTSAGFCSWEEVTWDTAVVLKTILMCLKRFSSNFTEHEKGAINEIARQTMAWLNHRFMEWEKEVKFPFGPADIAQILITSIYIKKHHPRLFHGLKEFLEPLHRAIANYLLVQAAETAEIRLEDGKLEKVIWWGDYFQTAEVLESLALYYDDLKHSNNEDEKDLKIRVEKAIRDVCTYIERTQLNGMWGTHVDTIRILYTYIRVSALFPVSCQPHLVFKALRWICDEKQRLADGSFLHTMFLTIFMAPALVAVHNDWSLASKRIAQVYDDALWAAPAQSSVERIRRFEAETRISILQNTLDTLKERISSNRKLLISLALTIFTFGVVVWLGWWNESFTIDISVKPENLLKILPAVVTVYVALLIAIWRSGRR